MILLLLGLLYPLLVLTNLNGLFLLMLPMPIFFQLHTYATKEIKPETSSRFHCYIYFRHLLIVSDGLGSSTSGATPTTISTCSPTISWHWPTSSSSSPRFYSPYLVAADQRAEGIRPKGDFPRVHAASPRREDIIRRTEDQIAAHSMRRVLEPFQWRYLGAEDPLRTLLSREVSWRLDEGERQLSFMQGPARPAEGTA